MRLERSNKLTFVAIFVFFVTAASFIEIISSLSDRGETESHLVSLHVRGGELYLANHLRASQSARERHCSLVW